MPFTEDDLWPHFVPIWKKLLELGAGEMFQIAGGYGLFLKQQWLLANRDEAIVIPLEQWIDPAPRATSDFDLLLGLEFIADRSTNLKVESILQENGFEMTEKPLGQRWQFVKTISDEKTILAELHAPTPAPTHDDLRTEKVRIKPRPSQKGEGVHGRHNREAVGAEMFPFRFSLEAVPLAVPNPVTWTVMKLTAMADFWRRANDSELSPERRSRARDQAEKHAQDVGRIVAMMTIEERDQAAEILETIRKTEPFQKAATIFEVAFRSEGWAMLLVHEKWASEDLETIIDVLRTWFAGNS